MIEKGHNRAQDPATGMLINVSLFGHDSVNVRLVVFIHLIRAALQIQTPSESEHTMRNPNSHSPLGDGSSSEQSLVSLSYRILAIGPLQVKTFPWFTHNMKQIHTN